MGCKLGSADAEALRVSWDNTVQLTSLDLSGNPLGNLGIASLSRFLIAFTGALLHQPENADLSKAQSFASVS